MDSTWDPRYTNWFIQRRISQRYERVKKYRKGLNYKPTEKISTKKISMEKSNDDL